MCDGGTDRGNADFAKLYRSEHILFGHFLLEKVALVCKCRSLTQKVEDGNEDNTR